jgi:hypothetical protein
MTAYAAVHDDSGPGESHGSYPTGGGGGPDWKCGQQIGKQKGALYHLEGGGWVKHYSANYPNCNGSSNWKGSGALKWCQAGFEVYRFYGQNGAKPAAVTRSRLELPGYCQSAPVYRFSGNTSWDAGIKPGSPDYIPSGTNRDRKLNGLPAAVGRREGGFLTSTQPTKVYGSCTTVDSPNPMKAWWAKASRVSRLSWQAGMGEAYLRFGGILPLPKPLTAAELKRLKKLREAGKPEPSPRAFPRTAAQQLGFTAVSGYFYDPAEWTVRTSAPKPKVRTLANQAGLKYFMQVRTGASPYWNDKACATPLQFATVTQAGKAVGGDPLIGTCYIPVIANAKEMTRGGRKVWTYQELGRGFGERYSTFYAGSFGDGAHPDAVPGNPKKGSKGRPKFPAPGTAGYKEAVSIRAWRAAMKVDYLDRAKAGYLNSTGTQILPAQAHPGERNNAMATRAQNYKELITAAAKRKTAEELRRYAKCLKGSDASVEVPGSVSDPQNKVSLGLELTDPEVLQVGGRRYQATFRVKGGAERLVCDGKPCGASMNLKSLSYDMKLTPPSGYSKCGDGQRAGCDFKIVRYEAGTASSDGLLVAEFYTATRPEKDMTFTLSNLKAVYEYSETHSGMKITGYDPLTGKPIYIQTAPVTTTVTYVVAPSLTGTPRNPELSGGVYSLPYPVIGSVDVPIG